MTPDQPRTAAGRTLYDRWSGAAMEAAGDQGLGSLERDILAIEAEAAQPPLDVDRLARAMFRAWSDHAEVRVHADNWKELLKLAQSAEREYNRLAGEPDA